MPEDDQDPERAVLQQIAKVEKKRSPPGSTTHGLHPQAFYDVGQYTSRHILTLPYGPMFSTNSRPSDPQALIPSLSSLPPIKGPSRSTPSHPLVWNSPSTPSCYLYRVSRSVTSNRTPGLQTSRADFAWKEAPNLQRQDMVSLEFHTRIAALRYL
eukprot:355842-Chlamydomonas_euryale.AAC.2